MIHENNVRIDIVVVAMNPGQFKIYKTCLLEKNWGKTNRIRMSNKRGIVPSCPLSPVHMFQWKNNHFNLINFKNNINLPNPACIHRCILLSQ